LPITPACATPQILRVTAGSGLAREAFGMGPVLGTAIDLIHATLMAAWALGLPLLFWHRWPRLTRAYAIYAVVFVVVNLVSRAILGECFLTTLARACWRQGSAPASEEWFTVRLANAVFRFTPSHHAISAVAEILILVTAIGVALRISDAQGRHMRA
jgi:hypothetical protein